MLLSSLMPPDDLHQPLLAASAMTAESLMATRKGFSVRLPQAADSLSRGQQVVFDPVNRLFLVAQEFTSTGSSGSSIQVFDTAGNFVESIDDLNFANPSRVVPGRIALNPALRTGYVEGPHPGESLQSFTY